MVQVAGMGMVESGPGDMVDVHASAEMPPGASDDCDDELPARIVIDPGIMAGQPCIQGSRLPARPIVSMLAHGSTYDELHEEDPGRSVEEISACVLSAATALERRFAAPQETTNRRQNSALDRR